MLRIGFAARDITPQLGHALGGYDHRHVLFPGGNIGVHDPLSVRVLVLDGGDGPFVLCSFDLLMVSRDFCERLRGRILATCSQIQADRIMIACIHTHAGPWLQEEALRPILRGTFDHAYAQPEIQAPAYTEKLFQITVETLQDAAKNLVPATMRLSQVPLGLGYNRRVNVEGSLQYCWNPAQTPHLKPAAQPDPTLTLCQFQTAQGGVALFSHATHPVVLGQESNVVSADWPGAAIERLETLCPGVKGMFLLGAAAESHPWLATQNDPAACAQVGDAAAQALALLVRRGGNAEENHTLSSRSCRLVLGREEMDLTLWRMGDLRIAFVPLELFGGIGLALAKRLNGPVIIATCANGWHGYLPDAQAFSEGGYEVGFAKTCGYGPEDAERLISAFVKLDQREDS